MTNAAYRPDVDGLRCLAVVGVVLFHAFPGHLLGGFVGVDVFFVISGFVITRSLMRDVEEDRASIVQFYRRRVLRILPALALVLAAVLAWGWATMPAAPFRTLGGDVAAAAASVANLRFWADASYFDTGAIEKPLLHLWSLGVEEQFYLVWPILIFALAKRRLLQPALALLAVVSFGISLHLTATDPTAAFFSPVSRFWELAGGGLVALAPRPSPRWARWLAPAGVLTILASFVFSRATDFPGWQALLPVLGTVATILAGPSTSVNRVLARRPFVAMGLISYPLYLWHWPLLSFAYLAADYGYPPLIVRAGLIVLAVILAWASYRVVERRARRGSVAAPLVAMGIVLIAGTSIMAFRGVPSRPANHDPKTRLIADYAELRRHGLENAYRAECDVLVWGSQRVRTSIDPRCTARGEVGTRMLWGDSHAQALSLGLREIMPRGVTLAQVATSACAPSFQTRAERDPLTRACDRSNALAAKAIAGIRPETLYVTSNTPMTAKQWTALVTRAHRLGAGQVVVVGPVPQWEPSLPVQMARRWPQRPDRLPILPAVLADDLQAGQVEGATYVSLTQALCDPAGCRTTAGRSLMAVDGSHLSPAGSRLVGRIIQAKMEP